MYIPDINPYNNGIFVMPADIADKHLKMASGNFIKAVIYIFRHADTPIDAGMLCEALGIGKEDAEDALTYWCSLGVLRDTEKKEEKPEADENNEAPINTGITESKPEQSNEKPVVKTKPGRLSYQQICARLAESTEVRFLFNEAQLKLGRTIGTADQSALLNLHDFYGLPVEVILAICEYAKLHGKSNNINYIFTVGADWSNREIDSLEAADDELKKLENISSVWPEFCRMTGNKTQHPTTPQSKYLDIWTNEWNFSLNMITAAYEEMSRHTESVSFPYMNKILAKWHSDGIKTPEEAAMKQKEFEEQKEKKQLEKKKDNSSSPYGVKKNSSESGRQASFDIDKATEYMNTTVPKYKKKEKR